MTFGDFKRFKMNEEEIEEVVDAEVEETTEEESEEETSKGCLMAYYEIPKWDELLSEIDPEHLYEGDDPVRFGLEEEPHITILYGFDLEETNKEDIQSAIDDLGVEPIDDLKIEGIGVFENDDYDVLKITVVSETLSSLNEYFKNNFKYDNEYPEYKPHITIAYLNKGESENYLNMDLDRILKDDETGLVELVSNLLVYSEKENGEDDKLKIDLYPKEEETEDHTEDNVIEDLDEE